MWCSQVARFPSGRNSHQKHIIQQLSTSTSAKIVLDVMFTISKWSQLSPTTCTCAGIETGMWPLREPKTIDVSILSHFLSPTSSSPSSSPSSCEEKYGNAILNSACRWPEISLLLMIHLFVPAFYPALAIVWIHSSMVPSKTRWQKISILRAQEIIWCDPAMLFFSSDF